MVPASVLMDEPCADRAVEAADFLQQFAAIVAIATATGLHAALSTGVARFIVARAGYSAAFLFLACVAAIGLALFAAKMPATAPYQGRSLPSSNDSAPRVMSPRQRAR
jgi:predicted MFS family arabinose efflux permease